MNAAVNAHNVLYERDKIKRQEVCCLKKMRRAKRGCVGRKAIGDR